MRWQPVKAIATRQAYVLRRSPHRLFDVTIWPVVDTLLFGSLAVFFARAGGDGGSRGAGYLFVGVLLWHVVYQSQIAVATGFLEETWSRNLLNLMVTPLTEAEWLAGVVLFGFVKLVMGVGAVALMVAGLYAFDVTDVGWALLPIFAVLLAAGWAVAMFVIGMVLRFGTGAEALAWGILFVVMPLSGAFYPVSALPAVLRPVSAALPTTHAFAAARGARRRPDALGDARPRRAHHAARAGGVRGVRARDDGGVPQARVRHALLVGSPQPCPAPSFRCGRAGGPCPTHWKFISSAGRVLVGGGRTPPR